MAVQSTPARRPGKQSCLRADPLSQCASKSLLASIREYCAAPARFGTAGDTAV
jgi:hypothetical protein